MPTHSHKQLKVEHCHFLQRISTRKKRIHENKIFDLLDLACHIWESGWLLFVNLLLPTTYYSSISCETPS